MNIVITGGSNGLGKAMISSLYDTQLENTTIYNIDRELNEEATKNFKTNFNKDNMAPSVSQICDSLPDKIDILINNMGINHIEWIDKLEEADYDHLMSINVKLSYLLVKNLSAKLRGGTILNIVSNASDMAMTNSLAYNMSKGAMKIGTKQMARELGKTHDITVFGISPNKLKNTQMSEYIDGKVCELRGWTPEEATKYQCAGLPAGEETDPETLSEFIGFLLSKKQRHKYLQGCILNYGGPIGN